VDTLPLKGKGGNKGPEGERFEQERSKPVVDYDPPGQSQGKIPLRDCSTGLVSQADTGFGVPRSGPG